MLRINDVLWDRYRIRDLLPSGGQSDLAIAEDLKTGVLVVIKQLTASPASADYEIALKRFRRAATLHINHPAVVNPLSYVQENDTHYAIFPFIEGVDLDTLMMQRRGALPITSALSIIEQVTDALIAVHAADIVHRDIKPGNIVLSPDERVKLIDFGVCRLGSEPTISTRRGILGSPWWFAPEQMDEPWKAGPSADLYATGAVLYYLLTGQPPFRPTSTASGIASIRAELPIAPHGLNPRIPEAVSRICLNLLQKAPAARYGSAHDVKRALQAVANPGVISRHCTSCGAPLSQNSSYCTRCGAPQAQQPSAQARCIACGHAVGSGMRCPACGRQFSAANHRFRFTVGLLAGVEYRIPEGRYCVGRSQLLAHDHCLSRQQFMVVCMNGTVTIQDARATNRTYLGGQYAEQPLIPRSNDELRIGNYRAVYLSQERSNP